MATSLVDLVLVTIFMHHCWGIDFNEIKKELENNMDLELMKDLFKIHIYKNPHPICALENELCSLDNNCCKGLECKLDVDHQGLKYSCQIKILSNSSEIVSSEENTDENDVHWTLGAEVSDSAEDNLLKDHFQNRLKNIKKEENKLLNEEYYLIKELQKPLTFEEMLELQQLKELEELKKQQELKQLKEWAKNRQLEEQIKEQKRKVLEKLANDRVKQVLKEEERQKLEMFRKMQESFKRDLQAAANKPR